MNGILCIWMMCILGWLFNCVIVFLNLVVILKKYGLLILYIFMLVGIIRCFLYVVMFSLLFGLILFLMIDILVVFIICCINRI